MSFILMSGKKNTQEYALSTPITMLIITAISSAVMASLGSSILVVFEKTMPHESIPAFLLKEEASNKVMIVNPSHYSVNLSLLEVYIDGERVAIGEENGDKIWSPGEKLWITIPEKDSLIIDIYYDRIHIFRATYFKPLPIYHDKLFPSINTEPTKTTISDDTAVVALAVYVGTISGERMVYNALTFDTSTVSSCYDAFRKTGLWTCDQFSTTTIDYEVTQNQNNTNKTLTIGNVTIEDEIHYIRFVAYDITGKPSSVIVPVDSTPIVIIENVVGDNNSKVEKRTDFWFIRTKSLPQPAEIILSMFDDKGLASLDVSMLNTSTNISIQGTRATHQVNISIHDEGTYPIEATVKDISGLTGRTTTQLELVKDDPPQIILVSPETQTEIVFLPFVEIIANIIDDFLLQRAEIYVNDALVETFTLYSQEATCSKEVELLRGSNLIRITATDDFNQTSVYEFSVIYNPDIFNATVSVPEVGWMKKMVNNTTITS